MPVRITSPIKIELSAWQLRHTRLWPDRKPVLRLVWGHQFPVVAEDQGGAVAGLEGDLGCVARLGEAVGAEAVAEPVLYPGDLG